jgi:hypothetical protein
VASKEGKLCLELVRHPLVVCVEEGNPGRARVLDARVAGRRDASVRLVLVRDERAELSGHLTGGIGGAVVDDDDFRCAQGLVQHTGDGLGEELRGIIGWNDNRYWPATHEEPPWADGCGVAGGSPAEGAGWAGLAAAVTLGVLYLLAKSFF